MKKLLGVMVIVVFAATFASAELLVTANPLGQGRFAGLICYLTNANVDNISGMSTAGPGAYLGYGITEKIDIFINAGQATASGLPLGVSAMKATAYGLSGKYALMEEGDNTPVSVALGVGYKNISTVTTVTGLGDTTAGASEIMAGIGVSKILAPFVPYAALAYRTDANTAGGTNISTQIDLTVGTAIAWSEQGAVLIEDTLQSITPNGGSNYTSNQIAAGVAYKI